MMTLGNKLRKLTTLALLLVFTTSCSKNEFSGANSKAAAAFTPFVDENGDLVFLEDSFERDVISDDNGWRGFILDGVTNVLNSFQSNGAGARIPPEGEFGPAATNAGARYLLVNGRPNGDAIEQTHVISQSYDLSQYNTVVITFKYLTVGLNDAGEPAENLKLQVCKGTLNECGANDDALNADGLLSDKWVTVFTSPSDFNDDGFNGKNHVAGDWQNGVAAINLNNPEFVGDGSTFVFRFVGTMKDGIKPEECPTQANSPLVGNLKTFGSFFDPWTNKWDTRKHSYCNLHKKQNCNHHKCKEYNGNGNHYGWCKHKHSHGCKHNHHICPQPTPTPKPTPTPCPTPNPTPTPNPSPTPSPQPTPTPTPPVCVPSDGTLQDGILIDQIRARATEDEF